MGSAGVQAALTEPELKLLQARVYHECGMHFDSRRADFLVRLATVARNRIFRDTCAESQNAKRHLRGFSVRFLLLLWEKKISVFALDFLEDH